MTLTDKLATRSTRMKTSEICELLKLPDQPDILSFAGGIPDPALFPAKRFAALRSAFSRIDVGAIARKPHARRHHTCPKASPARQSTARNRRGILAREGRRGRKRNVFPEQIAETLLRFSQARPAGLLDGMEPTPSKPRAVTNAVIHQILAVSGLVQHYYK